MNTLTPSLLSVNSEDAFEELSEEEGEHCVGSNSHVEGGESSPQPQDSLSGNRLSESFPQVLVHVFSVLVFGLLLQLGLHVVEGQAANGDEDS